ncbi:hypothetical protein [Acidithiobacillus sp.]|uniref:hypothetical protein n=1 Tax=Acidithiobacillus sp. TaxID=1872118 RepID=UPI00261012CE|nr:hypothetical protein [Acidithiobacillus sp.]MDD2750302.1 hypothetical protein [Acidithiobacillus sp.]MDD5280904.1 hypothetical protein [Acidithiobacillus sp.]
MTVYKRIHIIAVTAITLLFLLNTASDAASFRLHGMTAQEIFSNAKAAAPANACQTALVISQFSAEISVWIVRH